MTVGIVGLGLIGGSFAKVYHENGEKVLAYDKDKMVFDFACISNDVDGELNSETIKECDLILISIFPEAAVQWFKQHASEIDQRTIVIDCCGTKQIVCNACFPVAKENGVTFLGGHPMAGTHHSGFKYASQTLYKGAPMVIVTPDTDDIELLDKVKKLLSPAGFAHISVTTAEQHDKTIAFTSQLAHVVSSAYIKSPTAKKHIGFSAGSYADMTRVAQLNPTMWSELFIENKDNLLKEINTLINNLNAYKEALEEGNQEKLTTLLDEGRKCKEEVDGK